MPNLKKEEIEKILKIYSEAQADSAVASFLKNGYKVFPSGEENVNKTTGLNVK